MAALPRVYWYIVGATLIGGAGAVATGPIGGALSDRFGRRHVLVGEPAITALATLHLMTARSPAHIAVAAALWGFCANVQRPAAGAAIADVVPPASTTVATSCA